MKKLVLSLALILFSIVAVNAQTFGIKGGLNLANINAEVDDVELSSDNYVGFQVGGIVEFDLQNSWFLNSGLLYSLKGWKQDVNQIETKGILNYLVIPVTISYKHDLGGAQLFGEAGPYAGIGLKAKIKGGGEEEDLEFGSDEGQLKQLDFGLTFGGGVQVNQFKFAINYDLGLTNLSNVDNAKFKTSTWGLSVAYMFGE